MGPSNKRAVSLVILTCIYFQKTGFLAIKSAAPVNPRYRHSRIARTPIFIRSVCLHSSPACYPRKYSSSPDEVRDGMKC